MRELLKRALSLFLIISAATLWAIVLAGVSLSARDGGGRWLDALAVMRGDLETLSPERLAELRSIETETNRLMKQRKAEPTYELLARALDSFEEEKIRRRRQLEEERERLALWKKHLSRMQQDMNSRITRLKSERQELLAVFNSRREEILSEADAKVLGIYRQMEAGQVAADLVARYQMGETEQAVRILSQLQERKAAEVLAEIDDPSLRSRLINDMREHIVKPLEQAGATLAQESTAVEGASP